VHDPSGGSRVCQGADHSERAEREPNEGLGGLGAEPPAGSRGRAPGGGSGGEAESFLSIFMQKSGQKLRI